MSYKERDEEPNEAPFQAPVYVDEVTRRRRLIPSLVLAVPMIIAFALVTWTQESMNAWAVSAPRLSEGAYELLLMHMFAHGGLFHIAFNLMALFVLGPSVMERLGPFGWRSLCGFMALFFSSGLFGVALWLVINPSSTIPMLGASGAIFGLLGFLMRQPDPHGPPIPLASPAMARAFVEWIKLHLPLVLLFAIPMLFGSGFFGLAWEAHLGGFLGGLLLCGPLLAWFSDGPDWIYAD